MSDPFISPESAAAMTRVLGNATFELIPLKNVHDQAGFLPEGATVSVTASPAKGIDATVDLALGMKAKGFDAIPHLSARLVQDRSHLERILARLEQAAIDRAFVVGGDAEEPGDFFDGLSLLEAMTDLGHHFSEIGIPGYPEGHAFIPDDKLLQALQDKQPYANYMTTQMCFDPVAITRWIEFVRERGIELPVDIGIPGVAPLHKLITISARIGIGQSIRFLTKQRGLLGRMVRPGGYAPDELLAGLGSAMANPEVDIRGVHVYTFNRVDTTEEWRVQMLEELAAG